jgi:hypothetical protein
MVEVLLRAHEGLISLSDELVSGVVLLRGVAVHHIPMIANHHALLEEGLVGAGVSIAASFQVTHVVHLQQQGYTA